MRTKINTPLSRAVVAGIIARHFEGSQGYFSSSCGVDTAYTSRVVGGSRAVTMGFVRQVVESLDEATAASLVSAFISDVANALSGDYAVTAVTTLKRRALVKETKRS